MGASCGYLRPVNQRELRAMDTAFRNFFILCLAKLEVIMLGTHIFEPSLL